MRWLADPLFRRVILLAAFAGAGAGADTAFRGWPDPVRSGMDVALAVMLGAAAMRWWTWKGKP